MESRQTLIEDNEYLQGLGILIPGKKYFENKGFLKLYPEDFIVEEITKDNETVSIFDKQEKDIEYKDRIQSFKMTLIKRNIGTMESIADLAKKLNIKTEQIQHAGIKDNDALTSQKLTIQNVSFNDLQQIKSDNYYLTNIEEDNSQLKIGELKGNQFTIFVRLDKEKTNTNELENSIKKIQENGFYNFYYSQRFGTLGRDNNHLLGRLVLQKKYNQTIFKYLTDAPKSGFEFTFPVYKKIKENYGNWEFIEKLLIPYSETFEKELKIVRYLKQNPDDYLGAILLEKEDIRFWLLGFASWMFNIKLSKFIIENNVPNKIELITSTNKNVVNKYKEELSMVNLDNFDLSHLEKYNIQKATYPIDTMKTIEFHKIIFTDAGVILKFSLDKGSYATTALAHCFDLIVGSIPKNYSQEKIDLFEKIENRNLKEVLDKFKEK